MSKLQCRPGDLAVVVSPELRINLGNIVRVIKPDQGEAGFSFSTQFGPVWWCVAPYPMTWRLHGELMLMPAGPIPDSCLQPIRPQARDGAFRQAMKNDDQSVTKADTYRPLEKPNLQPAKQVEQFT